MRDSTFTETVKNNHENWVEGFARFGYAALGAVYCLMGVLTAMATMGLKGGETANPQTTFRFLLGQPLGKVLLGLVAIGLLGYVTWQAVQVFKDPQNPDSDSAKGYGRRLGFALSGGFHAFLSFYAAKLVINAASAGDGGGGSEFAVSTALQLPFGKWLVLLGAAGFIGFGIYQFYVAISGSFMKYMQQGQVNATGRKIIERTGRAGFAARGVVFSIVGYLFGKAALTYSPSEAGDTESALQFLESASIPYLVAVVALGLVCYGLFMFVRARHQSFNMNG